MINYSPGFALLNRKTANIGRGETLKSKKPGFGVALMIQWVKAFANSHNDLISIPKPLT